MKRLLTTAVQLGGRHENAVQSYVDIQNGCSLLQEPSELCELLLLLLLSLQHHRRQISATSDWRRHRNKPNKQTKKQSKGAVGRRGRHGPGAFGEHETPTDCKDNPYRVTSAARSVRYE